MVLPPVSLLPSPKGSVTDGISEGRAERCECFLRDLALVLPRAFLPGGLVDGDLPEDNSSSVGASPSPEIIGSLPLFRAIRCLARSPSRTSFPRS